MKAGLSACIIFLWLPLTAWGLPYALRTADPYLLKPGAFYLGLEGATTAVAGANVNSYTLIMDYAVNESVMAGVTLPYLHMMLSGEYGLLGDADGYLRLALANSPGLEWRMVGNLGFRLGTGVRQPEAVRRSGTDTATYYPLSTGAFSFIPAFLFSLFAGDVLFTGTLAYHMEHGTDEPPFTFNLTRDVVQFSVGADYSFKLGGSGSQFTVRPDLTLDARIPLSAVQLYPPHLSVVLSAVVRYNYLVKGRLFFSAGVLPGMIYTWSAGAEAGWILL